MLFACAQRCLLGFQNLLSLTLNTVLTGFVDSKQQSQGCLSSELDLKQAKWFKLLYYNVSSVDCWFPY